MTAAPASQVPGIYRRRIGDILVTALSDGYSPSLITRLRNIDTAQAQAMLGRAFRAPEPRVSINVYAIEHQGRLALVDTGSGTSMGPTMGQLIPHMRAAGLDPARVDTVLLTHMHPDHANGLSDDAGTRLFPNATLRIHHADIAHWTDDAEMAAASERAREKYFQANRRQLALHRDCLAPFDGGEVFPGVTAEPIPGHTPGHTAFLVESRGERLLIWGDIVHHPDIQIERPEVGMEFDTDIDQAIATRRQVLARVADERLLIAGMHVHFPGFAYVSRQAGAYRLHPEGWVHVL